MFIVFDCYYFLGKKKYKKQNNYFIVDLTGSGDYKTITEALNNAPEGSIIFVKIGTYQEIINIKTRIKLVGEDKNKTIINPVSEKINTQSV
ncbi:MAG: pectinesterase family protein [Candidatus Thermoplasmatota archaeon]|jgi:pectin methylesterase-like acyl-CoA thioesterase|nr:pectinesterase family protein [Candidatus Thermoplasmatota archaeon]